MKGGTLEFDIVANNDGIKKALNETEKRIAGFSKATVEGGKSIDAMFDATNENIRIQKQVIKDLESEYAKLEKNIKKVGPGRGQDQLQQQANAVKAEIEAEKNALTQLEGAVKKNEAAHVRLRTQVRNVVEQLAAMEQAGQRGTDAYKELQAEAGRLTDAMGDAQTQAKILAHDNAGLQGVISAVSGVAGAFSAAQGTIGLFAGENENLQKIMVKVQSLMAITIGLQQVANTLNKDSYFRIVALTKAKAFFSGVTLTAGKALVRFGVSANAARIAATALTATLTLGLSVAIGVAVSAINRLNKKREEANRILQEQIELESDARGAMIKARFEIDSTMRSIKNFTGTKAQEQAKVEELNKKYGETFGSYNTLSQWYDTLSSKAEDYIQMLFMQAKVQSLVNKAIEADAKVQEVKATDANKVDGSMGWFAKFGLYTAQSESSGNFDASAAITKHNEKAKEAAVKAAEEARDALLDEAKELYEGVDKLGEQFNNKNNKNNNTKTKDPVIEQLEARKAAHEAYNKWVKAGLGAEANVFFNDTIGDGDSYIQYLEKLKTETTLTKEQLAKVNSEIADVAIATQQTQLADFETELQNQLSGAQNIMQMLDILEQRRNALSGDGSDLDNAKSSAIDKQAEEVAKQAEEQTQELLSKYADYLGEKIAFEASYAENSRLLNENLAKAKTEDEKRLAIEAIKNLDAEKAKYAGQTGNADYDALLGQFKSYQQKRADISADYDAKIALASEKNNAELVARLEAEKKKALSSETLAELLSSDSMTKLLGNLDDLTTAQIQAIIDKVNGQKAQLAVELDPADLEVILNKLQAAKDEVQERNPFKALSSALKAYKDEANKANLGDISKSLGGSIDMVKGAFDSVVGGLTEMGLAGDEVTQDLLGDISTMLGGASDLAMGIATGNPLQIIQGSITLITSAFEVFNVKDRQADRSIARHAESIKQLERSYIDLERAVDRALGSKKFDAQKAQIDSLQKQTQAYAEMVEAERGKKKSDQDKVEAYEDAAADNARKIADIISGMRDDITGSAADIANELGNVFFEAMAAGENALDAFNNKAEDVVKNIVQKMLVQKLLEQPIGQIIDKYASSWVDENGNFAGYDAVINSAGAMGSELQGVGAGFAAAIDALPEEIKKYFTSDSADVTGSLSGAIKGSSQESIDLLAGQTNAVRVNQIVSIDLLREQLVALTGIYDRVGTSNRFLEAIERNTAASNYDPLRAQGITL